MSKIWKFKMSFFLWIIFQFKLNQNAVDVIVYTEPVRNLHEMGQKCCNDYKLLMQNFNIFSKIFSNFLKILPKCNFSNQGRDHWFDSTCLNTKRKLNIILKSVSNKSFRGFETQYQNTWKGFYKSITEKKVCINVKQTFQLSLSKNFLINSEPVPVV